MRRPLHVVDLAMRSGIEVSTMPNTMTGTARASRVARFAPLQRARYGLRQPPARSWRTPVAPSPPVGGLLLYSALVFGVHLSEGPDSPLEPRHPLLQRSGGIHVPRQNEGCGHRCLGPDRRRCHGDRAGRRSAASDLSHARLAWTLTVWPLVTARARSQVQRCLVASGAARHDATSATRTPVQRTRSAR